MAGSRPTVVKKPFRLFFSLLWHMGIAGNEKIDKLVEQYVGLVKDVIMDLPVPFRAGTRKDNKLWNKQSVAEFRKLLSSYTNYKRIGLQISCKTINGELPVNGSYFKINCG